MYCLKSLAGPGQDCSIEVDHIIPQAEFKKSPLANKSVIQDNLYNYGTVWIGEAVFRTKEDTVIFGAEEDSWGFLGARSHL